MKPAVERVERVAAAGGENFDAAVSEITSPAHETEPGGFAGGTGPKPDTLDFAGDEEPLAAPPDCAHCDVLPFGSPASRLRSSASSAISLAARASRRAKDQFGELSPRLR